MLTVTSLSAAYGERLALQEVNFNLPGGRILAVIGPNGAGKTTLVRAISGSLPVQSGDIQVDRRSLKMLSAPERARLISVVPQARNLPPAFTARETVMLGRTPYLNWFGSTSEQDEEIVRQALERTDSLALADRRMGELSGGEQQRVLLARALAQKAPLMLLDEPTTHLDLAYQVNLLNQVQGLVKQGGLTVLVALHDLNLVGRYADLVALLVKGRLAAWGTPSEVLLPEVLSPAYGLPLELIRRDSGGAPVILPSIR